MLMSARAYKQIALVALHLPGVTAGLVLAVLIPLACVIHCMFVMPGSSHSGSHSHGISHSHAQHSASHSHGVSHSHAQHSATADHTYSNCGMHKHGQASEAFYPRALYELIPLAPAAPLILLLLLGALAARPVIRHTCLAPTPPAPPPRIALA